MTTEQYPVNEDVFLTLSPEEIDDIAYAGHDGRYAGRWLRHRHRPRNVHRDHEMERWERDELMYMRAFLALACHPDWSHILLWANGRGSIKRLCEAKATSKGTYYRTRAEYAHWLLLLWCIFEAQKRRRLQ